MARSHARVVILDPNGDFRNLDKIEWPPGVYTEELDRVNELSKEKARKATKGEFVAAYDSKEVFASVWQSRRFVYLDAAPDADRRLGRLEDHTARVRKQPLCLHWADLYKERDFFLQADVVNHAHLALGIEACGKYYSATPHLGLKGLMGAARELGDKKAGFPETLEFAANLTDQEWRSVEAFYRDLWKRYSLWWPKHSRETEPDGPKPLGIWDYVASAFPKPRDTETSASGNGQPPDYPWHVLTDYPWHALILSLDAAPIEDSLLAADVLLSSLWDNAKRALEAAIEQQELTGEEGEDQTSGAAEEQAGDESTGVPEESPFRSTYIVIDEAHNFAPGTTDDPLRRRVSDWLLRIASEGRKYGLYLILATQRPTKLHPGLVPECENSCVLRVQSSAEQEFAAQQLGIRPVLTEPAGAFATRVGLLHGHWAGDSTRPMRAAPARTKVIDVRWRDSADHLASDETGVPAKLVQAATAEALAVPPSDQLLPGSEVQPANTKVDGVRAFVVDELEKAHWNMKLVILAYLVRREKPEVPSTDWLGTGTFKALIQSLEVPCLAITPGADPWVSRGGFIEAENRKLAKLGLPELTSDEYAAVFERLAGALKDAGAYLDSDALRKACFDLTGKGGQRPIHFTEVQFIQRGVQFAGHEVGAGSTPDNLRQVFRSNTMNWAAKKGIELSHEANLDLAVGAGSRRLQ